MTGPKKTCEFAAIPFALLIGVVTAGLCSAPVIYAASAADCAAQADRASRDQGTMIGGAGRGAVRGGAFGAIVGDSDSARRGAAIGAVAGSARRGAQKSATYNQVYDGCMAGSR